MKNRCIVHKGPHQFAPAGRVTLGEKIVAVHLVCACGKKKLTTSKKYGVDW